MFRRGPADSPEVAGLSGWNGVPTVARILNCRLPGFLVACLVAPSALFAQSDCVSIEPPCPVLSSPGDLLCGDGWSLDCFKDRPAYGDWKYTLGGEFRYRYMDEQNRLRPNGTVHNNYSLTRVTPFFSIGNDWITGYVQGIDAAIFENDVAEVPIDRNRADLLQYYGDVRLWDGDGESLRFRAGRQFLQYGSQHLISPLGWANTWRNFEGFRTYYQSADWNVDVFAVRPVNGAAVASQFRPTSHDVADSSVWLSGVYASRKRVVGGSLDLFWIWNKEDQGLLDRHDGNRHSLGIRHWGMQPLPEVVPVAVDWNWDAEGAWQFGEDRFQTAGAERDVNAGYVSAITGLTLTEVPWTPAISGLFWWGSGDSSPGTGSISTLTTLYPFGHNYWGLLDNFNGANLLDYSLQISVKPCSKMTLLAHWHWFDKANRGDAIYNIVGAPLGGATNSRHIGQELDLVGTYVFNSSLQTQLGYSWFWYGDAVDEQAGLARDDAHQFYWMTTLGF